jgi:hypothetical protein
VLAGGVAVLRVTQTFALVSFALAVALGGVLPATLRAASALVGRPPRDSWRLASRSRSTGRAACRGRADEDRARRVRAWIAGLCSGRRRASGALRNPGFDSLSRRRLGSVPADEREARRISAQHAEPEERGCGGSGGEQAQRCRVRTEGPKSGYGDGRGCGNGDRLDDGRDRRNGHPTPRARERTRALGAFDAIEASPKLGKDDLEGHRIEAPPADLTVLHSPAYNTAVGGPTG